MNVALIGAPESGKSDFARALRKKLSADKKTVHIVDDYIEKVEDEVDLKLGFQATYIGNLYAALGRFREERKAPEADFRITCGTLMENMIYGAADAVNTERYAEVVDEHRKRSVILMQMLGVFVVDLWRYDQVFYLPYETEREGYQGEFDKNIPLLLELWDIKHIKLGGTQDERVAKAVEALSEAAISE